MLSHVAQGLKACAPPLVPDAASSPSMVNETLNRILDHAKTSGLVDQFCLCLENAGSSLLSGSSHLLRAAYEACRGIWSLIDALEILFVKENIYSFPLNSMWSHSSLQIDNREQDRGSLVGIESTKIVDVVTRAFLRRKAIQVAMYYCLHRLEAPLSAGIQVYLSSNYLGIFLTFYTFETSLPTASSVTSLAKLLIRFLFVL